MTRAQHRKDAAAERAYAAAATAAYDAADIAELARLFRERLDALEAKGAIELLAPARRERVYGALHGLLIKVASFMPGGFAGPEAQTLRVVDGGRQ